jgi:hypothetical protein
LNLDTEADYLQRSKLPSLKSRIADASAKITTMGDGGSRKYGLLQDLLLIVVSVSYIIPALSINNQKTLLLTVWHVAELLNVLYCEECSFEPTVGNGSGERAA